MERKLNKDNKIQLFLLIFGFLLIALTYFIYPKFLEKKEYIEVKKAKDELPMKTPLTWLCRGCSYKEVCDGS